MLDRDRDFGECGQNAYGWKFYQDGRYFNKAGLELDEEGNLIEKEEEVKDEAVDTASSEPPEATKEDAPIPKPTRAKRTPKKTTGAKK